MKLWYSPASPFVRKAMVTAREAGIEGRLEMISVSTTVIDSNEALRGENPLGKIPALSLFDGRTLYDSRVICAYLADLSQNAMLAPTDTDARFVALTLEALADGIMEAAVAIRYENFLRPEQSRWDTWTKALLLKIETAMDSLETDWTETLAGNVTIGVISVGCALGYLDFRNPDLDWRKNRPKLADWYEEFAARPSMAATKPRA
jgi:glutathione S-transferase